ncbi:MAG: DUF368 domain-containing protein [Treponema sp.]
MQNVFSIIKQIIYGLLIGLSNVVPGVSGGTIACVLGVYEDLLVLPSLDISRLKERWKSVLPLFIGMGLGILLFSKLVTFVYNTYPVYTSYFFVGVIFASISFLFDTSSEEENKNIKKTIIKVILFLIALFIMTLFYILKRRGVAISFNESERNIVFYLVLICYCAIALAGMIIPGISGSFLLLLLGAYQIVMSAIATFDIKLLVCIGFGVLLGVVSTSRLIKFLIERFKTLSYSFILGLTFGSILHIFPFVCQPFQQRFISALMLLSGYVLVSILTRKSK